MMLYGPYGQEKEELHNNIAKFLKNHEVSELLEIVANVMQEKEYNESKIN